MVLGLVLGDLIGVRSQTALRRFAAGAAGDVAAAEAANMPPTCPPSLAASASFVFKLSQKTISLPQESSEFLVM